MKKLHDGTFVEDDVPTKMTSAGRFKLTTKEKNARKKEETESKKVIDADTLVDNRKRAYPPIGDQLDAILKEFKVMRDGGALLNPDLEVIMDQWEAVKEDFPKL